MSIIQRMGFLIGDVLVMVERNLIHYMRLPQLLVFSTVQPVMFLLLFTYVFGGAIAGAGASYIQFLLPGILVQSVIFGSIQTGVGLADDLSKGLTDRFRSLPMARSAVLAGRTTAEMFRNMFVVALMLAVGTGIGFRLVGSVSDAVAALMLLLLFGFAFSWISATIGLLVRNVESAQVAGFIWVFPLVFASSVFVPLETMPDALRAFAEVNPISVMADAVRALLTDAPSVDAARASWLALAYVAGILAIFMPLAVYLYRRSA
jgi:ABC-2 type transport system permease protein/oleandomycin transport system permease protein